MKEVMINERCKGYKLKKVFVESKIRKAIEQKFGVDSEIDLRRLHIVPTDHGTARIQFSVAGEVPIKLVEKYMSKTDIF